MPNPPTTNPPTISLGPELNEKVPLGVLNANGTISTNDSEGGVLQWQNQESVLVTRLVIDIATPSILRTVTCDFGWAATSDAHGDNLISALPVGVAGIFDSIKDGTMACVKVDSGKWVTGSKAAGCRDSVANLAGFAYITYIVLSA